MYIVHPEVNEKLMVKTLFCFNENRLPFAFYFNDRIRGGEYCSRQLRQQLEVVLATIYV